MSGPALSCVTVGTASPGIARHRRDVCHRRVARGALTCVSTALDRPAQGMTPSVPAWHCRGIAGFAARPHEGERGRDRLTQLVGAA